MWLVRFAIGVARPMAAGLNRLSFGPSLTTIRFTYSASTSSEVLSSRAACSALADGRAQRLGDLHGGVLFRER
jgi:hypothetical protein